jgi:hypothetical protein
MNATCGLSAKYGLCLLQVAYKCKVLQFKRDWLTHKEYIKANCRECFYNGTTEKI